MLGHLGLHMPIKPLKTKTIHTVLNKWIIGGMQSIKSRTINFLENIADHMASSEEKILYRYTRDGNRLY